MSYNRLAFIDGEQDPWRPVGVHGFTNGAPHRCSTTNRPFMLIKGGVHGWEAMGVSPRDVTEDFPPRQIQIVQQKILAFTKAWVRQWHRRKSSRGRVKEEEASQDGEEGCSDSDEDIVPETEGVCEDLISG